MTKSLRYSLELFSQLQTGCPPSSPITLTRLARLLVLVYLASKESKYILVYRIK